MNPNRRIDTEDLKKALREALKPAVHWVALLANEQHQTIAALLQEVPHPIPVWTGEEMTRRGYWWSASEAVTRCESVLSEYDLKDFRLLANSKRDSDQRLHIMRSLRNTKKRHRSKSGGAVLSHTLDQNPIMISLGARCFVSQTFGRSNLHHTRGPFNDMGSFGYDYLNEVLETDFSEWHDPANFIVPGLWNSWPVLAIRRSQNFYFPHESYLKLKGNPVIPPSMIMHDRRSRSLPQYGLQPNAQGASFSESYSTGGELELTNESWSRFFQRLDRRIHITKKAVEYNRGTSKPNIVFFRWDTEGKPDPNQLFETLLRYCGKTKFILVHIQSGRTMQIGEGEADVRHQEPNLVREQGGSLLFTGKMQETGRSNSEKTRDYFCATLNVVRPNLYWYTPRG